MVLLKILGGIDLVASIIFLTLIFSMPPFKPLFLAVAILLLVKGLFALTGDVLSFVDLISGAILIISVFFPLPPILIWVPLFLLLAKGVVSFF